MTRVGNEAGGCWPAAALRVLQADRTAGSWEMLYCCSECRIRGKGARVGTQSSCKAGTEAGGTTSQTERAHSHPGRTLVCRSWVIQTEFLAA